MSKESWRKELKTLLTVREVWSLIPMQVKAEKMTPKAATATFLRCYRRLVYRLRASTW